MNPRVTDDELLRRRVGYNYPSKVAPTFVERLCLDLQDARNEIAKLTEALGWFCGADKRFQVAVGGNPNVVDSMVAEAQARYATALADNARGPSA